MSQPRYLVTGASSGIGEAIANALLAREYKVVGLARDFSRVSFPADHFESYQLDLSDALELPDNIAALKEKYIEFDGIVLAAGQGLFGSLEEFSCAQIQDLLQVNLTSQISLIRAFIPQMKQKGYGRIVIIGSESAVRGARYGSLYCASKFGLRGFAQALRQECTQHKISVSLINPGMVATPFFDKLKFKHGEEAGQFILPGEVAESVCHVLDASPEINIDEINLSPRQNVVVKQ